MSTPTYDALIAAGAPELPEGYFYRVHRQDMLGIIKVQLRKRWKYGSTLKQEGSFWLPNNGSTVTAVEFLAEKCERLVDQHEWEENERAQFDRDLEAFIGDHP